MPLDRTVLGRWKKAELVDEVVRLHNANELLSATLDKDVTFRDLEVKFRDGVLDLRGVLGDGSQPVSKFLAAIMLHWLLGEGQQEAVEPENYLSGEFTVRPGGQFAEVTACMEIIKPGGKSSHKIREELEAKVARLEAQLADAGFHD